MNVIKMTIDFENISCKIRVLFSLFFLLAIKSFETLLAHEFDKYLRPLLYIIATVVW